jgi:hypothetical protein
MSDLSGNIETFLDAIKNNPSTQKFTLSRIPLPSDFTDILNVDIRSKSINPREPEKTDKFFTRQIQDFDIPYLTEQNNIFVNETRIQSGKMLNIYYGENNTNYSSSDWKIIWGGSEFYVRSLHLIRTTSQNESLIRLNQNRDLIDNQQGFPEHITIPF